MAAGAAPPLPPPTLVARRRRARRVDDDEPMDDAAFRPAVEEVGGGMSSPLPVLVAEPRRLPWGNPCVVMCLCRPPRTSSSKDLNRSQARTGACCCLSRSAEGAPNDDEEAAAGLEALAASPLPKAGRLPILVVVLAPAVPVPKPRFLALPRPMPLLDELFPRCLDASNRPR